MNQPHPAGGSGREPGSEPDLRDHRRSPVGGRRRLGVVRGRLEQRAGRQPGPLYQFHHQPFIYFQNFADGTAAKAAHLKDETDFMAAVAVGQHAAGLVRQADRREQRAPGLRRSHRRREPHGQPDQEHHGEPDLERHGDHRDLRRARRLLGPRPAAGGRRVGPGLARSDDRLLAVREVRRRSHGV